MTFNRLSISVIPVSQITPEMLANNNFIFVGKADGLPLLQDISLPAQISGNAYVYGDMLPSDGIIQMAVSPWNAEKAIMVVGGNEDQAVINAGRALSTGELRVGNDQSVSIVSNARPFVSEPDVQVIDQTFEDLGYESVVVGEMGLILSTTCSIYPKDIPLGQMPMFNLVFSHSSLLEYDRSNINVRLNDEPVGSIQLSEETAGQAEKKINLPASAARPGSNQLRLDIHLEPRNECVNPIVDGLWMRINSSSKLHLPLVSNPASASPLLDLRHYPAPFAFDPVMNDLAFVLAPNDPVGWDNAAQIAFLLGYTNNITDLRARNILRRRGS